MAMVRQTRQRAAVVEVLQASRAHPDAATIHAAVRERLPSVSLGTVYRTLDALVRDGVVVTLERAGQATRYDWRADEAHPHAVCRSCGAIFDVDATALPDVPSTKLPAGFRVTDMHLEFMGVCEDCQTQTAQTLNSST
ncbi:MULTISPECIES: Fur family transcriptional regulator [Deinococcus]|uniref:Fur family transcriptional regulator n=1 Tax=Deinococcus rufus TaxID=2136097 RepID=A0ABV7Z3P6_9DEIO|nr:transcriptional repressor [Deinococcus sp. AB2017081]WQE95294.1 transcriptional repressor [Deinococcus sp. AB2017081]